MKPKDLVRYAMDTPGVRKVILSRNRAWTEGRPYEILLGWSLKIEYEKKDDEIASHSVVLSAPHLYQLDHELKLWHLRFFEKPIAFPQ